MVWRLYDAYQKVLDTAAELRDRHQRPGAAVLVELTGLLAGESVEVPDGEIPLERRTLLGASQKRITLAEAVSRMSGGYARAAEVIAAADTAWTALLVPLEDIEETWRETARLAQGLDGSRHPELDRLGRELSALGRPPVPTRFRWSGTARSTPAGSTGCARRWRRCARRWPRPSGCATGTSSGWRR